MTLTSLRALTWGTVTGAVLSALLLAAGESGLPDLRRLKPGDLGNGAELPRVPTSAGAQNPPPRRTAAGSSQPAPEPELKRP